MSTDTDALVEDTLFVACTRPAMIAGVTMEAVGLNVIFSCVLFLVAGSIVYGLVIVPIHLVARLLCRHDPNQFRLIAAWIDTKGRHRNGRVWGGSSYTPLRLSRAFQMREIGCA